MAPVGQACTFRAIEDPLLGPVVSFGLAGDAVNLLDDWAHRVPPLSAADVKDFIRSPRAARKLFGYQGLPAVDVAALEDLAGRLAWLKDNHPEIALVEFNPVLCRHPGRVPSWPRTSGSATRPSAPTAPAGPCAADAQLACPQPICENGEMSSQPPTSTPQAPDNAHQATLHHSSHSHSAAGPEPGRRAPAGRLLPPAGGRRRRRRPGRPRLRRPPGPPGNAL